MNGNHQSQWADDFNRTKEMVEKCLNLYYTKQQTISCLETRGIKPEFTNKG